MIEKKAGAEKSLPFFIHIGVEAFGDKLALSAMLVENLKPKKVARNKPFMQ